MWLTDSFQKYTLRALARLPEPAMRPLAGAPIRHEGQQLHAVAQLLNRFAPQGTPPDSDPETLARMRDDTETHASWLAPWANRLIEAEDIALPGAEGARPARLYRPAQLSRPGPALLYFHGGGHVMGSIRSHDGICRALAGDGGLRVISYDYRLAPEHPFPAGIEDCIAAFRGLAARAGDHGIDPARIAVGGDSSGANCAAVVTQTCRTDRPAPAFQLLFVPWLDLASKHNSYELFGRGFMLEESWIDWFADLYLNGADASDPRVSPLYGNLAGLCPALVMTAGFDPLRDEAEAYAAGMRRAGVEVEHVRAEGMTHAFLSFSGGIPAARALLQQSALRLADALNVAETA
ncbi:alpha/beta hydrolase [Paracoccus marinaquae]|uniref:Alpha/beta hydrolase n=1 Tax=Paracoccus marinaquae TaxID=2841926 RepID=A0ABS6AKY2_9RHOB|nr:alpha/beta hydrolase [Paracoccus marinaquae]MBU3030562.1 alpha/beta hydrolase [Paracoccus marinaquae]